MVDAPIRLDRVAARRFLVTRHLLAPPRSLPPGGASVRTVFDRLGSIQFDPLEVTGRNHDLVLAARIGGYRREMTDALLYEDRWLYETYNKGLSLVPTAELPFYRISWDRARERHATTTLLEHGELVEELLGRMRRDGPLASTDVEPRAAIDWWWGPTNQVRAVLEALSISGIIALVRRDGNRRVYDLTERLFPVELLDQRPPEEDQIRHKLLSRYRAHGLLGMQGGQGEVWLGAGASAAERYRSRDRLIGEGVLVPVEVEGVRGRRLVLADEVPMLAASAADVEAGRPPTAGVAFLAPLDPLVWDRDLLRSLWDFDYIWEVYVPAARRRWGYYVLPLLWGDRFVGRIEPRIERRTRTLRVLDLWWESGFEPLATEGFVEAFIEALVAHARFLGAERIAWPRAVRHRALGAELRGLLGRAGRLPGDLRA